jgi:hypothetical protein
MTAGIAGELHRYAAAGLWRAGEVGEGLDNFRRAYEMADSVGLRRAQFLSASSISSFARDIGQLGESIQWMEKAERIADELPALRGEPGYISMCFEKALAGGDARELKRLLESVTQYHWRTRRGPGRLSRALEICIHQMSGTRLDPHEAVHDLTHHHTMHGESGNVSDLEAAIAATLLIDADDPESARSIVVNYLNDYRRGPTVIGSTLRDVIARLGISELPAWCRIYEGNS